MSLIDLTKSKALNKLIAQVVLIYVATILAWQYLDPIIELYFFSLSEFQLKGVKSLVPFLVVLAIAIKQEPPLYYILILCFLACVAVIILIAFGILIFLKFLLGLSALILLALLFVRVGDI